MQNKRRRLAILIPGFQELYTAGSQLALLKSHIELAHSTLRGARIAWQSYNGYRIETPTAAIDMFEADWQNNTTLLSAKGWATKLTWGAVLLHKWVKGDTLRRSKGHRAWFKWFAAMLAVIVVWWLSTLGALAATFNVFGYLAHFLKGSWLILLNDIGPFLKGAWLLLSFLLVSLGLSITASVDVADLFRRYLDDAKDDNGLSTRTMMRAAVREALDTLDDGSYHEVVLVGHSFGVLIAIDAIAQKLEHRVGLISLGGFLGFLAAESDWVADRIRKCVACRDLTGWRDYYSSEDVFASPSPVPSTESRLKSEEVALGTTRWQQQTGKAHAMYFSSNTVQDAILGYDVWDVDLGQPL